VGSSFELATPSGKSRVLAATRNDYSDGRFRIERPIHVTTEDLDLHIGDESGVEFIFPLTGADATIISFRTYEGASVSTSEDRVRFAAGILVGHLAELESSSHFITSNTYRTGSI
jgi:hypothetical protein